MMQLLPVLNLQYLFASLATGADTLIDPDVLSRHFHRLRETTDPKERLNLHNKAIKRGKFGWTVGRDTSLPRHHHDSTDGDPTGRQLSHSHIRSGHFHVVKYGPQKIKSKVVFL